jgi:small subunit ribosomal protein S17
MPAKQLKGTVVSNKMTKALVVKVESIKVHPLYHKRFKSKKSYSVAHTGTNTYNVGDAVTIMETKPVSKTIRFKVVE